MSAKKILKLELGLLFIISICCFCYALFNLDNSDHIFSIHGDSGFSSLTYYIVSALASVYHFVGPWSVFCFIFFSLVYFRIFRKRENWYDTGFVALLAIGLLGVFYYTTPALLGGSLEIFFEKWIGAYIAWALVLTCLILGFATIFEKSPLSILKGFARGVKYCWNFICEKAKLYKKQWLEKKQVKEQFKAAEEKVVYPSQAPKSAPVEVKVKVKVEEEVKVEVKTEPVKAEAIEVPPVVEKAAPAAIIKNAAKDVPQFKASDLIQTLEPEGGKKDYQHPDEIYFNSIRGKLESKLTEFKIEARVIDVLKGPVVDTFELELGSGVRVTKVTTIQDDLSLALSGAPIRVVYPMKGRTTIGIEVPRNPREVILLDEVLTNDIFMRSKAKLPICMGKDAFGDVMVVDLAKMPHMLVAGATGAGKSVFINTLLVSLLVKLSHHELKLILIDPKQLELAQYAKLPHLCLPVVTEPGIASASLLWAVEEMERRYTLLKDMGVRNLEGFNAKVKNATPEKLGMIHQYYKDDAENGYELPYIVIIVDEFADLILTKEGKNIESSICRLAAKARAAGIHIVLATQRPSVDVITGLIKNNFPTRVSFRVTSSMDSKTILTKVGAEKLLGMGDMLLKQGVEMVRVHSAYVGEDEVDVLCEKLEGIPQDYDKAAMDFLEEQSQAAQAEAISAELPGGGQDALFDQAEAIVREARGASASMLQRRLRIGYNRAANLIDQLEMNGVVGPSNGSKPREILAVKES